MRSDPRDAFDLAEDQLAQQLADGYLTQSEFNDEMRELARDYAAAAEEAAQDAYDAERELW
jgi:hypothetical protein